MNFEIFVRNEKKVLPGGFKMVNAIKSVAATVMVPLAWAARITLVKSWMDPSVSGYWKMTPEISFLEKSVSKTFSTSILISNGSARVCTQLMVWGCSLSDKMNLLRLFCLQKNKIYRSFHEIFCGNGNGFTCNKVPMLLQPRFLHPIKMH